MPFTLTTFRAGQPDEGHIASDGNIYITVSGAALLLIVICPRLSQSVASIGGSSAITCITYAHGIYILGRVCKMAEPISTIVSAVSIMKVEKLGLVADLLMSYARSMNLVYERAPSQLRFTLESFATALVLRDGPAAIDNVITGTSWFVSVGDVLGDAARHHPTDTAASSGVAASSAPWIDPPEALGLTVGHLGFNVLGLFELAVGARWDRDARGPSGGMAAVLGMILPYALSGVARAGVLSSSITIPDWVTPQMVGEEVGKVLAACQPPPSLEQMPFSLLDARRTLAAYLRAEVSDTVTVSNVVCCVDHHPPLITILGGSAYCTLSGSVAWAQLRALATELAYTGTTISAGQVATMADSLKFAATGLANPAAQALTPEDRTAKVIALIKERIGEKASGKGTDPNPDDKPKLVGYPVHYQAAIYSLLADTTFVAKVDEILKMFADDNHPTTIIATIIQSGYAVLYYPLMGVKDEVPLLPVVKMIAENLRAFGPAFFGQLGFELVMPMALVAKGTTTYPELHNMWNVWKTGSVTFDIENDFKYATEAFYSCQKDPASVQTIIPKDQIYSSATRNTMLLHRIFRDGTGLFAALNLTGGNSAESVLHASVEHYNEASLMPETDRRDAMRTYVTGTMDELSTLRMAAVKKGDPSCRFGGDFVVKYSRADELFAVERGKLGGVSTTAQGLRDVGLGHLLPTALIVPPDIRPDGSKAVAGGGGGAGSSGGDGGSALKAAADKAKADAAEAKAVKAKAEADAKAAKVEAVAIGSRAKFTSVDDDLDLLVYKMANNKKEAFPITGFFECDEVPDGACMSAWCSRSESFWAYCRDKDHPDHQTKRGGAHAVKTSFRGGKVFKTLLAAGMATLGSSLPTSRVAGLSTAAGVSVRASPSVALRDAFSGLPDSGGISSRAPPLSDARELSASSHVGGMDAPAYLSPLGVPIVSLAAGGAADLTDGLHVFMPVVLTDVGAAIGMPGGAAHSLFGIARVHQSREVDYDQAAGWSRALFPSRADVHPFYLFEINDPPIVVSGALVSDPPPEGWKDALVDSSAGAAGSSAELVWSYLPGLLESPLMGRLCALGAALGESFEKPSAAIPADAVTGVFGETALDARQVLLSASVTPVPWDDAVQRGGATVERIRRALIARRDDTGTLATARRECADWLSVCRPLQLEDVDDSLRTQCFRADDPRIGRLIIPRMPSVASAPLAPLGGPPPYHRVPSYAIDWDSVLRPKAYAAAARCEWGIYRYLCELAVCDNPAEVSAPTHFACGTDSYYPWAAALVEEGEVLVKRDGRITLLDKSQPPNFTLSPTYAQTMLADSPDAALRDACTVVGVDFGTKLGGQTVMFPPNSSLWNGFSSVHQSLSKMVNSRGWFKQELVALEAGRLELLSVPGRHAQYFCVPRSYSDEWRMVVNDSHGDNLFTTVGVRAPLVSLNASTGVQFDKALRRVLDEQEQVAPAAHDLHAPSGLRGKFGKPVRARVRPAMISAQAVSARPPYHIPAVLPGSGPGAPVLPPEFKPFLFQLFVIMVVLSQCGQILGQEVVVCGDDYSKFFHQLALATRQAPFVQLMALDPAAVTPELMGRALSEVLGVVKFALIMSFCVSMGTSPSSSYAQRYLTEFCNGFADKFHREHLALYEEWAEASPRFREWWGVRKMLLAESGLPGQDHFMCFLAYTDDPEGVMLESLVPDFCCAWGPECDAADLTRGDVSKRHLGVHGTWVGAGFFATGLLGYISPAKQEKARTGITRAQAGASTYKEMRELGGFLHHLVFNMLLPKHVMYNFYDGVDRLRRERAAAVAATGGAVRALFLFGGPSEGDESMDAIARAHGVQPRNVDHVNGASFDLNGPALRASILADIEAGVYSLVVEGPPCRSYSVRGRKLRSEDEPRGCKPIPPEWAAYLRNDTSLARFAIRVAVVCDRLDLLWLAEHPSPRRDKTSHAYWPAFADRGTIWDEPDFAPLLARPSVDWFDFAQCFLGSEFQKYTRVVGHRVFIGGLRGPLFAGKKCVCGSHAKVASGVNEHGEYHSRGAAHYPVAMKIALVSVGTTAVRAQRGRGARMAAGDRELPDSAVVPVTRRSATALSAWAEALSARSGSSMLAAVFHSRPADGVMRHRIRSDAATDAIVKGTADPGITACYLGHYVTAALAGTGWGVLPIVALEFGGQGPLGLLTFDSLVPADGLVVLPGDSLVVPTVMASRARGSRLLVFMHQQFLGLEVVQRRLPQLHCAHEYGLGVGMGACDCGSRGRKGVLEEVLRHQRLVPHECAVPAAFTAFMDAAVSFFHSLAAEDRARDVAVLDALAVKRGSLRAAGGKGPPPSSPPLPSPPASPPAPEVPVRCDGARSPVPPLCAAVSRWVGWVRRRFLSPVEMAVGHSVVCDVAGDGARFSPPETLTGTGVQVGAAPPPPVRARVPIALPQLPSQPIRRPASARDVAVTGSPGRRFTSGSFFLTVAAVDAATQRAASHAAAGEPVAPVRVGPPRVTPPSVLNRVASRSLQYARPPILVSARPAVQPWWRPAAAPAPSAVAPPAARDAWVDALVHDASPMAIMPDRPDELAELLGEMRDLLSYSFAGSTNKLDSYHIKAWGRACQRLGTPMWRTDALANSGADAVGYRRELLLPALAILIMYAEMSPRSHADPAPNPRSVMAKIYAVGREHVKRGFKMAPFTMAAQVVQGMLRRYVEIHGADALAPARKKPLTNALILLMLATANGATLGGHLVVNWACYFWISVRATFSVLAETGMRKGDVSKATQATPHKKGRLTFGKLKWRLGGVETAAPTRAELHAIADGGTDGCWLTYGALKNDAFGEFFGSKPSWLPFSSFAVRNACRSLAELELAAIDAGLTPDKRGATPLFGPSCGVEWHHSVLDAVFVLLLRCGAGLSAAACHAYSVHSYRVYLACALYASGCPPERIMAILRWKSEEALLIYARLNDCERTAWIAQSMTAVVDSTTAAHLPRLDADQWVAALRGSAGGFAEAAADADRRLELEGEA